jgi:hypothetical protein
MRDGRLLRNSLIALLSVTVMVGNISGQTLGCTLRAGASSIACSQVTKTLGDSYNDTGYNHEIFNLTRAFSVQPAFYACLERGDPNAFALPEEENEQGTLGAVFLGMKLARRELQRSGQYNNFTLAAILAHEVGHLVQFREGNDLATKPKELQADYLAGWYMANRDRGYAQWSETSARQNMDAFYRLGDYDYNNQEHHGTPEERLAAVTAGFRSANLPLQAVYQASYRFVSANNPAKHTAPEHDSQENSPKESSTDAGGFGEVLQSIIESAGDGFRSIKGRRDPDTDGDGYISKVALPGAVDNECTVWIYRDVDLTPRYSCDMAIGDDASSKYDSLVESISQVLGSKYLQKPYTGTHITKGLTFESSDIDVSIYVNESRTRVRLSIAIDKR